VRKWRLSPTIVVRLSDGTFWCADGACMFPLDGFNFGRAEKALVGWWVYTLDRWITFDGGSFKQVKP